MITKDNLAKCSLQSSLNYNIHKNETIKHLFFECCFAQAASTILQMAICQRLERF
jgi:hypothetical protein